MSDDHRQSPEEQPLRRSSGQEVRYRLTTSEDPPVDCPKPSAAVLWRYDGLHGPAWLASGPIDAERLRDRAQWNVVWGPNMPTGMIPGYDPRRSHHLAYLRGGCEFSIGDDTFRVRQPTFRFSRDSRRIFIDGPDGESWTIRSFRLNDAVLRRSDDSLVSTYRHTRMASDVTPVEACLTLLGRNWFPATGLWHYLEYF